MRGRTISHSASTPMTAQPTMTAAIVVAVMPASREIQPTIGEMKPATPKFVAPIIDAAVPAALPCRSRREHLHAGEGEPARGHEDEQRDRPCPTARSPSWSNTMIADAATHEHGGGVRP